MGRGSCSCVGGGGEGNRCRRETRSPLSPLMLISRWFSRFLETNDSLISYFEKYTFRLLLSFLKVEFSFRNSESFARARNEITLNPILKDLLDGITKQIDPFFFPIRHPSSVVRRFFVTRVSRNLKETFKSCDSNLLFRKGWSSSNVRYLARMDPERPEIKGIFATITRRGSLTVPRRDQDTHTHTRTQVLNWPDLLQWFVFLLTEGTGFLSR